VNFLIDECLYTSLVEVAFERGHGATHVNYRGLSGVHDWHLMAPIREGDLTFVTNNAKDFRRLYAHEEVHAGLVILIPNVPPTDQRELFDAALDDLELAPSLINKALEVGIVEGQIKITRYDLPARAYRLK
jgi:predicted nuclease of predicted toxin-antitoxin system